MECVRASFERLAVRGEAGLAWEEDESCSTLHGGTYEASLIKLNSRVEASVLLLRNHVALEEFTVDVVVTKNEEEEEEGASGGVLNFIQERFAGGKKKPKNLNNNNKSEEALVSSWEVCRGQGYHGLYALAKITPDTLPNNPCRERYTAGQYAEALLGGCRAHFMFQRPSPIFEAQALGLWGAGGGGCVSAVGVCYLVLAWRLNERETAKRASPLSLFHTVPITPAAAATTFERKGRKRAAVAPSEERNPITPARKRTRVAPQTPPRPPPAATWEEDDEEEEEEEEDITLPNQQAPPPARLPPSPAKQPPATAANQRTPGKRPANQRQAPATATSHTPPSPPSPVALVSPPQNVTQEPQDDLADLTFGFERSTPRGRGRGRRTTTATTTPRKSVLLPQWSEEEKEELLTFFDTLNPSQTEQTCIALTCKFATMRFGRDLPSKQLYQWVQQKNRTVHPRLVEYNLPGGNARVHSAAADLYRSLNQDVSESKRVAFTCRFLQTQYGVELSSKGLFAILSGGGKKRGGRAR